MEAGTGPASDEAPGLRWGTLFRPWAMAALRLWPSSSLAVLRGEARGGDDVLCARWALWGTPGFRPQRRSFFAAAALTQQPYHTPHDSFL